MYIVFFLKYNFGGSTSNPTSLFDIFNLIADTNEIRKVFLVKVFRLMFINIIYLVH